MKPHTGPTYCKVFAPLWEYFRPGAKFLLGERALAAVERLKALMREERLLRVPDGAAAVAVATVCARARKWRTVVVTPSAVFMAS